MFVQTQDCKIIKYRRLWLCDVIIFIQQHSQIDRKKERKREKKERKKKKEKRPVLEQYNLKKFMNKNKRQVLDGFSKIIQDRFNKKVQWLDGWV